MSSKQLDSILNRVTPATPPKAPETAKPAGKSDVVPLEPARKAKPAAQTPPKAEPQRAIQAYVPASVARAINIKAAEEGVTVRAIILQALQAIGITVPDDEVRDRRRNA